MSFFLRADREPILAQESVSKLLPNKALSRKYNLIPTPTREQKCRFS